MPPAEKAFLHRTFACQKLLTPREKNTGMRGTVSWQSSTQNSRNSHPKSSSQTHTHTCNLFIYQSVLSTHVWSAREMMVRKIPRPRPRAAFSLVEKKDLCPGITLETDEGEDREVPHTGKHTVSISNPVTGQEWFCRARNV